MASYAASCQPDLRASLSSVEQRLGHLRADGPDAGRRREQISDGRRLRANAATETQRGIERRLGDPDLFVRGRDLSLGRGDVGPSFQKRGGESDRQDGRRRLGSREESITPRAVGR